MCSSQASRRTDRLEDLPGEVFEKIVCLLTFQEKAAARLVSKRWKAVVEYIFSRQKSICISIKPNAVVQDLVQAFNKGNGRGCGGWWFKCDHVIDKGFAINLPYDGTRESQRKKSADLFVTGCRFLRRYFTGLTIIHLPWCWAHFELSSNSARIVSDACEDIASHYEQQVECFSCPFLRICPSHSFPELKHLACGHILKVIRNFFNTMAPKLQVLQCTSLHPDNFDHLPIGFLSIETAENYHSQDVIGKILRSNSRQSIRSIRLGSADLQQECDNHFPNLMNMDFWINLNAQEAEVLQLANIISRSVHLQRLHVSGKQLFASGVIAMTKNLRNLRELSLSDLCRPEPNGDRVMQSLAQLEKLQRLEIKEISCMKESVIEFLRGKSRKTLTHFTIESLRVFLAPGLWMVLRPPDLVDIRQEMKAMTQTESLLHGCVNDVIVRKRRAYNGSD